MSRIMEGRYLINYWPGPYFVFGVSLWSCVVFAKQFPKLYHQNMYYMSLLSKIEFWLQLKSSLRYTAGSVSDN